MNVIGSLVIGVFTVFTGPDRPLLVSPIIRAFVTNGVPLWLTTFSSFSLQTMFLVQDRQWLSAVGNVTSSGVLCLLATGLGIALANTIPGRT